MQRKHIRIALEPTDVTFLMCIVCGKFRTEYAVVTTIGPEVGIHKACIDQAHQKRGSE
jgi:hypothetical protein